MTEVDVKALIDDRPKQVQRLWTLVPARDHPDAHASSETGSAPS
jgi:hypothetical protein